MAAPQFSPGVQIREIDLTTTTNPQQDNVGVVVGPFARAQSMTQQPFQPRDNLSKLSVKRQQKTTTSIGTLLRPSCNMEAFAVSSVATIQIFSTLQTH